MKIRTTRKAIVQNSDNIVSAGYCDLQYLLRFHEPKAYTAGVYGWNFDMYHIYGVTICTGYRNMPGRRAAGIKEFESKAADVINAHFLRYDEQREELEKLVKEFCKLNGGSV